MRYSCFSLAHAPAASHAASAHIRSCTIAGTYTFNQWKVKGSKGQLLGVHAGQSATVTIRAQGCTIEFNHATADADDDVNASSLDTPKGRFSIRAHVLGLPVWVRSARHRPRPLLQPSAAVRWLAHTQAAQVLEAMAC